MKPQGQLIVIFGASGDLSRRKLFPALYSLWKQGLLPERYAVLGVGRSSWTTDSFRVSMEAALKPSGNVDPEFLSHLHWLGIEPRNPEAYPQVAAHIRKLCADLEIACNCLFYLATPPELYPLISLHLADQGLSSEEDGSKRLVVEKPFGKDYASAHALNRGLLEHWKEHQIFRIDHYLGKETVQNLLVFRFANELFDSVWNHRYVDYVEITSAESIGVGSRAGYFDGSGIVRDMVQNHLLQVLAMVAIDPPVSFDSDCVRQETMKIFRSLRPFDAESLRSDVVFGQYMASRIRGESIAGYRQEANIPPDSRTDTFAAIKIHVDHHRWFDVPFYIRTGKRLPTSVTEVVLHFKKTPHPAFGVRGGAQAEQNRLVLRIQPDEGILLEFGLKQPGSGFHVQGVNMDFHYSGLGSNVRVPAPYERLLLDGLLGDATLYALGEAVESCWQFIDPVVAWRESGAAPVHGYPAGSWGPMQADALIARDGRHWRYPCKNLAGEGEYCEL